MSIARLAAFPDAPINAACKAALDFHGETA